MTLLRCAAPYRLAKHRTITVIMCKYSTKIMITCKIMEKSSCCVQKRTRASPNAAALTVS